MSSLGDDRNVIGLPVRGDARGSLCVIEGEHDVPFAIARVYYIFGTELGVSRGFHAHRALRQFAVCVKGSCIMTLDDGKNRHSVLLDRPDRGSMIESMIWHEMHEFSNDAVLMVLASERYAEADYIRDYDTFLTMVHVS